MKKEMPISEFVAELLSRIDDAQDINCCKEELKTFCSYVVEKMGDEPIALELKD